ncbi:MAG: hypothetical protein ACLT8I_23615 [Blautia faecis]
MKSQNVSGAVAEEKTKQMAESRIETEKSISSLKLHAAERNFQDHAPKTEAVLLGNRRSRTADREANQQRSSEAMNIQILLQSPA